MNRWHAISAVLLTVPVTTTSARAERITLLMSGTVEVTDPTGGVPLQIQTGQPFMATLSYDTDAADAYPDEPIRGDYTFTDVGLGTDFHFTFSVAGLTFQPNATDNYQIWVQNDVPSPLHGIVGDSILLFRDLELLQTGDVPPPGPVLQLNLRDPTAMALDSDRLPIALDAAHFENATILLHYATLVEVLENGTASFRNVGVQGTITSIRVIPEPGALPLCGAGACGVWLVGFLRRKGVPSQERPVGGIV